MSSEAVFNSINGLPYTGVCIGSNAFFLVEQQGSFSTDTVEALCPDLFGDEFLLGAITEDGQSLGLTALAFNLGLSSFTMGIKTNAQNDDSVAFTFVDEPLSNSFSFEDTTTFPWNSSSLIALPEAGIVEVQVLGQDSPSWTIVDASVNLDLNGFLCRQTNSDKCFARSDDTVERDFNDGETITVAHQVGQINLTEGQTLCEDINSSLAVISSKDEIDQLAEIIFLRNSNQDQINQNGYWLGIAYNAEIDDLNFNDGKIENVDEVISLIDEDLNNDDDLVFEVQELLKNIRKFPWFGSEPQAINAKAALAIKRDGSKILLEIRRDFARNNMIGAICRNNSFIDSLTEDKSDDSGENEDEDDSGDAEDDLLFLFLSGISIFLLVILVLFVSLYYQQRQNKK